MSVVSHKSLSKYIDDIVLQLEYNDIDPSKEIEKTREKIVDLLSRDNPYWNKVDAPESWALNWDFFTIKSYNNWGPVNIGITLHQNKLRVTCFDETYGSNFSTVYLQNEESFKTIWINHGKLAEFLYNIFVKAINYSNREAYEDSF